MNAVTETKAPHPLVLLRDQLGAREAEFKAALPAHIPVERFIRVLMTACQMTPGLLEVERRSLFNAAVKAAQDGLLPDGREGAIVIYKDKLRGKIGQWMPMIAGIRKKVRNSGEIATWDAQVVYEHDAFEYELGDDPFIRHKPNLVSDRGKIIGAYSVAVLKTGEKSREVMSISEIESVRRRSRAAEAGPWITDYAEMCRKTVARRHSKVLPMSTDLDDLIRRDDALYDMQGASDKQVEQDKPKGLMGRLDALAAPSAAAIEHDAETGEIIDNETTETRDDAPHVAPADDADTTLPEAAASSATTSRDPLDLAYDRGLEAGRNGIGKRGLPAEYRDEARGPEADAWHEGRDVGVASMASQP